MRFIVLSNLLRPLLAWLLLLPAGWTAASLTVSAIGLTETVNFDGTVADVSNGTWQGKGFQSNPTAGQLDSDSWAVTGWSDGDLAFGQSRITSNTDYVRGEITSSVTLSGLYAFTTTPTNRALWVQPTLPGDFEPGTVTLKINNGTGATHSLWDVSYLLYNNNDGNRSNTFNFSFSADNSSYTAVGSLNFTSPGASDSNGVVSFFKSTQISVPVLSGAELFFRWSSDNASVSGIGRDEFGLDNISVTASAVPEPAAILCGALVCGMIGLASGGRRLRPPQDDR